MRINQFYIELEKKSKVKKIEIKKVFEALVDLDILFSDFINIFKKLNKKKCGTRDKLLVQSSNQEIGGKKFKTVNLSVSRYIYKNF